MADHATHPRLAAWDRLHAALERLPGWRASRPEYHPDRGAWRATAYDGRPLGRGKPHEALEADGATEAEAIDRLADLVADRSGGPGHPLAR